MDNNKAVVTSFIKAIPLKGLHESLRDHGTGNYSWWVCGVGDFTQHIPRLSEAFKKHFAEGLKLNPIRMVSEGDHVVVEAESDCRFPNGDTYQNIHCMWVTLHESKITHVREYLDNEYGAKAIAPILAEVFAEPI